MVWPLRDVSGLDRNPAVYWPEPHLELDPELEDGPVLVTLTYTVPPENLARFVEAMVRVRRMKLRTGATSFAMYRDGADAARFVEVAQYPSWAEHLRQHGGRLTGSDREIERARTGVRRGPAAGPAPPAARHRRDELTPETHTRRQYRPARAVVSAVRPVSNYVFEHLLSSGADAGFRVSVVLHAEHLPVPAEESRCRHEPVRCPSDGTTPTC